MSDDRGQAAIFAVMLLAIAAVVMAGLRIAQTELFAAAGEGRAGEAAVAAAIAVFADAYTDELRARQLPSPSPRPIDLVVGDSAVRETARVAASEMSIRNGGPPIPQVNVRCHDGRVEAILGLARRTYHADFGAPECFQR